MVCYEAVIAPLGAVSATQPTRNVMLSPLPSSALTVSLESKDRSAAGGAGDCDAPHSPPRVPLSAPRLLWTAIPLMFCHRGWFTAALVADLASSVLEPMQGVVLKNVTDALSGKKDATLAVLQQIPWYILILVGLGLLGFVQKCLKGIYDPLITFELQRRYLAQRSRDNVPVDVSRPIRLPRCAQGRRDFCP